MKRERVCVREKERKKGNIEKRRHFPQGDFPSRNSSTALGAEEVACTALPSCRRKETLERKKLDVKCRREPATKGMYLFYCLGIGGLELRALIAIRAFQPKNIRIAIDRAI